MQKIQVISSGGNNWSQEQFDLKDIPQEEIQQKQSYYINPESELMQSFHMQWLQEQLFGNFMDSDSEDDLEDLDKQLANLALKQGCEPQAIPVIRREQASYHYKGHVKGSLNVLYDETKIKKKVFLPSENNFNYAGLIIGPKGAN